VDEATWLVCTNPMPMVAFLNASASNRKLRLFCCACCRRIWEMIDHPELRSTVEVGERYADGLVSDDNLDRTYDTAGRLANGYLDPERRDVFQLSAQAWAAGLACRAAAPDISRTLVGGLYNIYDCGLWAVREKWGSRRRDEESAAQTVLLRDVAGNPFRPFPARTFPPHVLGLAQDCYAAFPEVSDHFLILADALAELGEDRAAAHCREVVHVKGCHVLDWILGKK
jgi:hypothetical protein